MKRSTLSAILLALVVAACGGSSPTNPTPPPSTEQTRIIGLLGHLNFGTVDIGGSVTSGIQITNTGNAPMTVTGLQVPAGSGGAFTASWTSGSIAAGGVQNVLVSFAPT